jgi:hypothetical protein
VGRFSVAAVTFSDRRRSSCGRRGLLLGRQGRLPGRRGRLLVPAIAVGRVSTLAGRHPSSIVTTSCGPAARLVARGGTRFTRGRRSRARPQAFGGRYRVRVRKQAAEARVINGRTRSLIGPALTVGSRLLDWRETR